jgi:chorismate mutase
MKLEDIRRKVDKIDRELLVLLHERMGLALRARRFKEEVVDEAREEAVLERAGRLKLNLVEQSFGQQLLRTIIEESKRLQGEARELVAFPGEHGSYGEVAARRLAPTAAHAPCMEYADVFTGVEEGFFDLGIVPVEHSLEGSVTQVNDLLTRTTASVVAEVRLPRPARRLLPPRGAGPVRRLHRPPQARASPLLRHRGSGQDAGS